MIVYIGLTIAGLIVILKSPELYQLAGSNPYVRGMCAILWVTLGVSFLFMLIDFRAIASIRRENTELDYAVYSDPLTGVANRNSCDSYIDNFIGKPVPKGMGVMIFNLSNMNEINHEFGHEKGDEALREFAGMLQSVLPGKGFLGRNGGNKFLMIIKSFDDKQRDKLLKELERKIAAFNLEQTAATGAVSVADAPAASAGSDGSAPEPAGEASGTFGASGSSEAQETVPACTIEYKAGCALEKSEKVKSLTDLIALSDRRAQ